MSNEIRLNLNIFQIIEEYNSKCKEIPIAYKEISDRVETLEKKCSTMGAYGGQIFKYRFESNQLRDLLQALKKSSWRYVYNALQIKNIAPQTHIKEFDNLLEDPPEFTADSIKSVFKDYVNDPRGMSLLAFAEIFCRLDKFYKSHSNIKIGVKGLPKRVIISGCGGFYNSYGHKLIIDVVNCLMRYRREYGKCIQTYTQNKTDENGEKYSIIGVEELLKSDGSYNGLSFKLYGNGNCHISFDKRALEDVNKALAEYYGEVLPDAYEHTDKPSASKEISKDLQFYRTPKAIVNKLLADVYIQDGQNILEPSCGDGAILDGIMNKINNSNKEYSRRDPIKNIKVIGVEFHTQRCEEAKAKGHMVINDNFLIWETKMKFDHVIMNPPFYGKHYIKHIDKAYELLKEGGKITAILPVTAQLNHGILDEKYACRWIGLPVGSFIESGTAINTVIVTIHKLTV